MFPSAQQTQLMLVQTGYIADPITATTVYLASELKKPILLEGPPGSGKTELAYAIARATKTEVERLQCFEGINADKAIGKFDESLQRLGGEMRAKSGRIEWEPLKQELHSLDFFTAGPLLRALQCAKPCVLLIDEVDKVDAEFQASDQTVANLASTEHIVVSVPADTEIYVVLQKPAKQLVQQAQTEPQSSVSASQANIDELRQLLELQREMNQSLTTKAGRE